MNLNSLSTGVGRVRDTTIAVNNNKAQKSTDAIPSFEETLPFSQHVTVRDASGASSYDRSPTGDNNITIIQNR
jgi:hypothetical protein